MAATVDAKLLDNPVYNPSIDESTVSLYSLMDTTPSDEVIADYTDVFNSMPFHNPFVGVLYNPRACEVDAINNEVDEIAKEIKDRYDDVINKGTPGNGYEPTPGQVTDLTEWNTAYPGIDRDLGTIGDIMDQFRDHTDRLVANFPSLVGVIQNSIGNNSAVNCLYSK